MVRASRTDSNQQELVQLWRAHGAEVIHTHTLKQDSFDVVVMYAGKVHLVEIKSGNKHLTDNEIKTMQKCQRVGVAYNVVRCAEDALKLIGK